MFASLVVFLRVCSTYEKYAQIYEYIGSYTTNNGQNNGSIFMKLGKMLVESIKYTEWKLA